MSYLCRVGWLLVLIGFAFRISKSREFGGKEVGGEKEVVEENKLEIIGRKNWYVVGDNESVNFKLLLRC